MKSGKDVKQDLKTADDLVNQLKRIYNDGYTAHAIDITKHFVHHVKGLGQFENIRSHVRPENLRRKIMVPYIDPKRYLGQIGPKHR